MRFKTKSTIAAMMISTVLSLSLLSGCDRSKGSTTAAKSSAPVPNVQVAHLKRGEIVRTITLPGQVRAYSEATLYAKVAGYLKSIAVDRGDSVRAGDGIAEIEAPELLADVTKLKAEVELAKIELKRVTEAQKEAPDLVIPQTVDTARGKFEVAKASLERIETLLGFAKISAPFAGIVTKRWADPGAFIPAATSSSAARNAALITLADFSRVRVEVAVTESEVARIRKDLPVQVRADGLPGRTFEGTITRFAYGLDEMTKTMATEIEIPSPDLALRPGMMASVRLAIERKPDALLLPAEALITEKNKSLVFVYRDGKAVRVPVKLGFDDGVSVEIVEGLQPTDAVILAGKQSVSDGQVVNATDTK
ncbi:MAG TPA: efflux RND transporter periplasmic adaptor subunit [Verrucomicrobiae bacterium]|jgi:membrane fusion protein (multidrug efflux system)